MRDGRGLVDVVLPGGVPVMLCGSHALMHERTGRTSASVAELRACVGERRGTRRRSGREIGEVDELAESLSNAFAGERRTAERRSV